VAKGKSNASAKTSSNSSSKRTSAASNKDGQVSRRTKKATEAQPSISNEQIGHVAGDVWRSLDKEGGQSLTALKKATGASDELILAAIGWLAREDKLEFTASGKTVKISLR
jgi:hypothetical protein